jgi:non-canonical (house-cleaning) NTP pyrophosphatase
MGKITIVVGSTRKPKLKAVSEALEQCGSLLAPEAEIEIIGREVDSGVGHTPSSREESMRGARQRAEALAQLARDQREPWHYFVGLEGGLDVVDEKVDATIDASPSLTPSRANRRVFLEGWAYVTNGKRGHFGRSGAVEIPDALAHEVLGAGTELSLAVDQFAGAVGIRDAQGAWGVLSSNLISRQEAFRVAVVAAFAPFYNAKRYRLAAAAR